MSRSRLARRILVWLERPIGLFFMTSCLVPMLGLVFTDRAACMRQAGDFPYQFTSVVEEYGYREKAFRTAQVTATSMPDDAVAKRLAALARGDVYQSADFKGKTMIDLVNQTKHLWFQMEITPAVIRAVWKTRSPEETSPPFDRFNPPVEDYRPDNTAALVSRYFYTDTAQRNRQIHDESISRELLVAIADGVRYGSRCGFFRTIFRSLFSADDEQIVVASFPSY